MQLHEMRRLMVRMRHRLKLRLRVKLQLDVGSCARISSKVQSSSSRNVVVQDAEAPSAVGTAPAPTAARQPPSPQRRRVQGCSPDEAAAAAAAGAAAKAAASAARASGPDEGANSQVDDAVMAQLMGMGFSAQKAGKVTLGPARCLCESGGPRRDMPCAHSHSQGAATPFLHCDVPTLRPIIR